MGNGSRHSLPAASEAVRIAQLQRLHEQMVPHLRGHLKPQVSEEYSGAACRGSADLVINDGNVQITTKEIREMEERWNALALRSEHPAVLNDITEVPNSTCIYHVLCTRTLAATFEQA